MSADESDLDAIFDRDKARRKRVSEAEERLEQQHAAIRQEASAVIEAVIRPALETIRDQLVSRGYEAAVEIPGSSYYPQIRLTFSIGKPYGLPSTLTFISHVSDRTPERSIRASWDLRVPASDSRGDTQVREFKGVDVAWVRGIALRFVEAVVSGS